MNQELKSAVKSVLRNCVFSLNNEEVRNDIKTEVERIGGVFKVICDETINTKKFVDNYVKVLDVFFTETEHERFFVTIF